MNELKLNNSTFEELKHIDVFGNEYWEGRELMEALGYTNWQKFSGVINRAIESCKSSNYKVSDHFIGADKMINIAKGAKRRIDDYKLSRYACYLIAQNGGTMPEDLSTQKKSLKELEKSTHNLP